MRDTRSRSGCTCSRPGCKVELRPGSVYYRDEVTLAGASVFAVGPHSITEETLVLELCSGCHRELSRFARGRRNETLDEILDETLDARLP